MHVSHSICINEEARRSLTEKAGMGSHVGALKHLSEPTKGRDHAFEQLKSSLGAVVEAVGEGVWVVGICAHGHAAIHATAVHAAHSIAAHAAIHSTTTVHTAHTAHAAIPRVGCGVWGGVCATICTNTAVWRGADPAIGCRVLVHRRSEGCGSLWDCRSGGGCR